MGTKHGTIAEEKKNIRARMEQHFFPLESKSEAYPLEVSGQLLKQNLSLCLAKHCHPFLLPASEWRGETFSFFPFKF